MASGRAGIWSLAVVLVGICLVFPGVARADIYNLTLNSETTNLVMGGVYTSPYDISVQGNGLRADTLALSCDDYVTDIYNGYSWDANAINLSDISNTAGDDQKFAVSSITSAGNSPTVTQVSTLEAYIAATYIANDILNTYNNWQTSSGSAEASDATTLEDDSYALWQIFDSSAWLGWGAVVGGGNNLNSTEIGAVNTELGHALSFAQSNPSGGSLAAQVVIFTPCGTSVSQCETDPSTGVSQEFIGISASADIQTPEGSSVTALGFELLVLCFAGLAIRRRLLRRA